MVFISSCSINFVRESQKTKSIVYKMSLISRFISAATAARSEVLWASLWLRDRGSGAISPSRSVFPVKWVHSVCLADLGMSHGWPWGIPTRKNCT